MSDSRIKLVQGDITTLHVDAIVNAANQSLLGGGGVDGAIHRAAGRLLLKECAMLGGCATGNAKITSGYNLPAKFIIHTVGPVYQGGSYGEPQKLADCYRNGLKLSVDKGCRTIAFPNISTGVYGYPKRDAAEIAVNEVKNFLAMDLFVEKVIFCCFDFENYSIYQELLSGYDPIQQ
jgi:O-acetyl-ADP-ribose deacetylase